MYRDIPGILPFIFNYLTCNLGGHGRLFFVFLQRYSSNPVTIFLFARTLLSDQLFGLTFNWLGFADHRVLLNTDGCRKWI